MKIAFSIIIAIHGLIHLMGFVKGFGLANVPGLVQPISRPLGAVWLVASLLILTSVVGMYAFPRWWWAVGILASLVSQGVILTSWSDAKVGTIGNMLLLIGALYGFFAEGPMSFRAEFRRAVDQEIDRRYEPRLLEEADLAHLPPALQKYVRRSGAVGQPRVYNFQASFKGRIRSGPSARWMDYTVTQLNRVADPKRLFLMKASMFGVPFDVFHQYEGSSALMRVRLASAILVTDARGPEMYQSETVTVLNDFCVLAPGALPFLDIQWEVIDDHKIKGTYSNSGQTVSAVLDFNESGDLVNFSSDDRLFSSKDGKSFTPARWETPLSDYLEFSGHVVARLGTAMWKTPTGDFVYGEFNLQDIQYNVRES